MMMMMMMMMYHKMVKSLSLNFTAMLVGVKKFRIFIVKEQTCLMN